MDRIVELLIAAISGGVLTKGIDLVVSRYSRKAEAVTTLSNTMDILANRIQHLETKSEEDAKEIAMLREGISILINQLKSIGVKPAWNFNPPDSKNDKGKTPW
jgi:hypothetical protein